MKKILMALLISLTAGLGPTLAQTDANSKSGDTDKAAISKSCTAQANAKGLHGEARKKFRSKCKKAGGKPA